jgi:hypothetical protein
MFFFNLQNNVYFSTFRTQTGRQYSFQKLTQFSQGNNVLDAPHSNVGGFLSRNICVSSTQLNRPILNKVMD